jgi:hypothetical protein
MRYLVFTGVNGTLMARRARPGPDRWSFRPSAFQAGHIPSWRRSCQCHALSPVAAGVGWWLLLLSRLLSAAVRRRLCPAAAGICLMTARTFQGMAPYAGQARCLALGFWPECFRRLNVKGGQRPFPKETRSALAIEGKRVKMQGPSLDLTSSVSVQGS